MRNGGLIASVAMAHAKHTNVTVFLKIHSCEPPTMSLDQTRVHSKGVEAEKVANSRDSEDLSAPNSLTLSFDLEGCDTVPDIGSRSE